MIECAEKGQVRYYRLKKIDTKILEYVKGNKKNFVSRDKLLIKVVELKEKKKVLTDKIEYSKDKTKKASMEKQLKTVTKDLQVTLQSLKDLEKPKIQEDDTDEEEEPIVKPKAKAKARTGCMHFFVSLRLLGYPAYCPQQKQGQAFGPQQKQALLRTPSYA